MIGIAVALALVVGPLLLGLTGLVRARRVPPDAVPDPGIPWPWKLTASSTLLYVLAFNLTFFVQELFLVLSKALTPGLRVTLFHNNHRWEGDHPLASLFQGTGALAIFLSGAACATVVRRGHRRSTTLHLLLIWMAYNGFFQALPQVVIGAVSPRADVGMAMDYLRLGTTAKSAMALVALIAMPTMGLWLTRPMLSLADDPARIATARVRTVFIFRLTTLPALMAIPVIILFRVPREFIEVVLAPVVVALIGSAWIQAYAWSVRGVNVRSGSGTASVAYPLTAVVLLLLVFQGLLRRGVRFY